MLTVLWNTFMQGLIVYDKAIARQRTWYIDKYIKAFKKRNVNLRLVTDDVIAEEIKNSQVDFAIMRIIAPKLSASLESQGIRCFNSHEVSYICNDKKKTYDFIAENSSVPFMPFETWDREEYVSYPCVVKARSGHGGTQVYWCESKQQVQELLEGVNWQDYIFQKPCNNLGIDVRVYVLGGRVVAAMKRENGSCGDVNAPFCEKFRSNYCLGGAASRYNIQEDTLMQDYVRQIVSILPMDFVGIDFIFHDGKPVFNEIEDVVGARMLYDLTDIDIVEEYADYIMQNIQGEKNE